MKLFERLKRLLFPEGLTCNRCGCELFEDDFVRYGFCKHCFSQMRLSKKEEKHFPNSTVYSVFQYDDIVRDIVIEYKDDNKRHLCVSMGRILADFCKERKLSYDIVTFVPCTKKNLRRRGYDALKIVAETFCRETHSLLCDSLARRKDNPDQATVDSPDRKQNVKDCFCVTSGDFVGKTVLILDDLVTSGATLEECARVLKTYGARRVVSLTFATA